MPSSLYPIIVRAHNLLPYLPVTVDLHMNHVINTVLLSEIYPSTTPTSYPDLNWIKTLPSEVPSSSQAPAAGVAGSPGPTPQTTGDANVSASSPTSVVDSICTWYTHFLCSNLTKNKNILFSPIANGFVSR